MLKRIRHLEASYLNKLNVYDVQTALETADSIVQSSHLHAD